MWYDLAILGILLIATFRGAAKGLVWQLAAIAAIVLCFLFAGSLSPPLARHIPANPPLNRWIAMFVLYLVFSFVSFTVARKLRDWIERVCFVQYDRHLGAIFGFLKGATFSLVLTFFLVTLSETARELVLQSRSGYVAAIVMDRLHPIMPVQIHDILEPYIHRLDQPHLDLQHAHPPIESDDFGHRR